MDERTPVQNVRSVPRVFGLASCALLAVPAALAAVELCVKSHRAGRCV